jgi:hypothetical protein
MLVLAIVIDYQTPLWSFNIWEIITKVLDNKTTNKE